MVSTNTTYRIFTEKMGATDPTLFVGDEGEIFYNPLDGNIRYSNGVIPGGINKQTSMIAFSVAFGI
jgi:hypothetical protein